MPVDPIQMGFYVAESIHT